MTRLWAGVKRWALNLLVAYLCFAGVGLLLGGLGLLLWRGHPAWTVPAAYAIAVGFGLVAAATIRGYLPHFRAFVDDRFAEFELWLFDHPVLYVVMYGAIGLVATAWTPLPGPKVFACAMWGAIGYFSLRGWRRRVATVRASN